MSDSDDSKVARGEYGPVDTPVRPTTNPRAEYPARCLRGHQMQVAGTQAGWSVLDHTETRTCRLCSCLRDPRATWSLVDVTKQQLGDTGLHGGHIRLEVFPPAVRGGVGRIQLRRYGRVVGDVDMAACGPCGRAVLEHIRVDEDCRRRGYGRVLLAATLVRAPASQFTWSTTKLADSVEVQAFWSVVEFPGTLGTPSYCTDMQRANDTLA
ncbi:MAG: hypothetical protein GEU98_24935 [Pseudonocardiaceae bacterium]|nr:hypothetical protein [Pseudonocardiaceae bacterium]